MPLLTSEASSHLVEKAMALGRGGDALDLQNSFCACVWLSTSPLLGDSPWESQAGAEVNPDIFPGQIQLIQHGYIQLSKNYGGEAVGSLLGAESVD